MYQYFVKIVPTIYESLDGNVINTNQFSVTEHTRMLPPGDKSGLPGTGSSIPSEQLGHNGDLWFSRAQVCS
jgi:hypothetical protein